MIKVDQTTNMSGLIFWMAPHGFSCQPSAGWRSDYRLQPQMLAVSVRFSQIEINLPPVFFTLEEEKCNVTFKTLS